MELSRMHEELEETVEHTANKIQEDMRAEMRKIQAEVTDLKTLEGK